MSEKIGVGTWSPSSLERELINDVLDSGRISYGPLCRSLEQKMAQLHSSKFGVLSNSGTSSLLVALEALKISRGWPDGAEVIVPALTFVATVNVVLQAGLKPVLVDIEPDTYGMSASLFEEAITDNTVCVIPVHLFGQPCRDIEDIVAIAGRNGIAIVEDSCECMFATRNGRSVGSFGDIGCFSFYVAHLITAGVGGMGITDDPRLAELMRSLVNHGRDGIYISIDDDEGDVNMSEVVKRRFHFEHVGHSFRITELEAALALGQLATWEDMIDRRRRNARILSDALHALQDFVTLPQVAQRSTHSWMMYPIVVPPEHKWRLIEYLEQDGIETREMVPLTNQPVYQEWIDEDDYPVAKWVNEGGLYVGCHQELGDSDMKRIAASIGDYYVYEAT